MSFVNKSKYFYENEEIRCKITLEKVGNYFIVDGVVYTMFIKDFKSIFKHYVK